jgi:hypothetical protein
VSLQSNSETDLRIVTGAADEVDIDNGALFVRFAEAAITGTVTQLAAGRDRLCHVLGGEAVVDAAGVVALFNAINRVADAIGIQFEDSKLDRTADLRDHLALDQMASARLPRRRR